MVRQPLLKSIRLLFKRYLITFLAWSVIPSPAQSATETPIVTQASSQLSQKPSRQVRFVEVPAIQPTILKQKKNEVTNDNNTLKAYTVPGVGTAQQIVIEELKTNKIFILEGLPPSPREFSQLTWVSEKILSAERWSSPHYGWRYKIDVAKRQLVREDNMTG